jgi:dipeptidyl aminopeptidase/acylaminoacyl peptidase
MVYSDAFIDADIARVSLAGARPEQPLQAETIIASTQWDGAPDYSADQRKIAFVSARSGHLEIWLADADGSNATQLTFRNGSTGTPRWSPGGAEIVFDSQDGEQTGIYTINVNSRRTRKITSASGNSFLPSWSRDGKSIYFVSDRRDEHQVWKTPAHATDGADHATQITRKGGFAGRESPDGQRFYYARLTKPDCIWTVAADGGDETEVTCPLSSWHYLAMFQDGFYYVPQISTQIWFFSFADRKARRAFDLKSGAGGTFAFSADGKWLLVSTAELRGDLYVVDNLD